MIFQALGAKYTFGSALQHLFATGTDQDAEYLRQALGKRYSGEVTLYRKGRSALAEAIGYVIKDEGNSAVAVSALTCYSLVQAVEAAGAQPVYVDINKETLQFGAKELELALKNNPDIKAVVVQNMLGLPADIAGIQKIINKAGNIAVIEDLAHSAGAAYADGREVGTVGDITMLSFGRDKAIDSVNGGALIVRKKLGDGDLKSPAGSVAWFDQLRDRIYPAIAWTSRKLYPVKLGVYVMALAIKLKLVVRSADGEVDVTQALPNWQAKLALDQVKSLTTAAVNRRQKSKKYVQNLQEFAPRGVSDQGSAPIRVPLLVSNRNEVVSHLRANGVQANDIWYDVPVSPVRFYDKVNYPESECPNAVQISSRLVNLPTHQQISNYDIERISKLVNEVVKV